MFFMLYHISIKAFNFKFIGGFIMGIEKMWIADQGDGTYKNPILYTDYSDPDVIRVENDYFMIASSFCNTPGLPVLHSKDLVNWKVISYVVDTIPFPGYDTPAHGRGVWAPAIRFHNGKYMVYIPFPDEGIYMSWSENPFDKNGWSELICVKKVVGWIDPCPFWDDDGKAYLVTEFARSRIGFKSILHLSSLSEDGTTVLDDGKHIFDGNETQPTIEGPKLYKRNGYYYIFAPAGGVKPGWQTVLRSKNIWGPYEEKIVMHQGNTVINGPHQGGWVDTPSGEDWFIHFQDVDTAGRIVHLQPMKWVNDWPVIGINEDENGCGEPVITYKKPNSGAVCKIDAPDDSDYFDGRDLGLQWQWNANYKKQWYDIDTEKKQLKLYSQIAEPDVQLCDVSNLLIQKWPAPEFKIYTKLDISNMAEGDLAGLVSLGGIYTAFAVRMKNGIKRVVQLDGKWLEDNESFNVFDKINSDTITIKLNLYSDETVDFEYSLDGKEFVKAGYKVKMTAGRWVGAKVGLFAINKSKIKGGYISADNFVFMK